MNKKAFIHCFYAIFMVILGVGTSVIIGSCNFLESGCYGLVFQILLLIAVLCISFACNDTDCT